jgi:hypothetical protein
MERDVLLRMNVSGKTGFKKRDWYVADVVVAFVPTCNRNGKVYSSHFAPNRPCFIYNGRHAILLMAYFVSYASSEERNYKQNKQTPWPLVRKRTIPTERPPLVDEI